MIDTTTYPQLLILKRHWRPAAIVAVSLSTVIVSVALGMPNIYRAGTKLIVERQPGASMGQQPMAGGLEARMQMIKQHILSRDHLTTLIEKMNLYADLRATQPLDVAITRLERDITFSNEMTQNVNGQQGTLSFNLNYTSADPVLVAEVANTLASFYVGENDEMRVRQATRITQQLKTQVDEAREQLEEVERRQAQFYKDNVNNLPEAVNQKSAELTRVTNNLGIKTSRQASLALALQTVQTQIAAQKDNPTATVLSALEQRRARLQGELDAALAIEREGGPTVRILRPQIAEADRLIQAEKARPSQTDAVSGLQLMRDNEQQYKADLAEVKEEITALEGRQRELNVALSAVPVRLPQQDSINRDYTQAREQYDKLRTQYNQAHIQEQSERDRPSEEFRVLEPARAQGKPFGPPRLPLIVGGILASLIAGLAVAVLLDFVDTSFHTMDELRDFTHVPILASIPLITTTQQKTRRLLVMTVAAATLAVALAGASFWLYDYAQRHAGITRIVTRGD